MSNGNLPHFLRKVIPEENQQRIVAALRINPLMWEYLKNTDIQNTILSTDHDKKEFWFPANLALLQFSEADRRNIVSEPMTRWSESLQNESKQIVTGFDKTQCFPKDIRSIVILTAVFYHDIQDSGILLPTLTKIIIPNQTDEMITVLSFLFGWLEEQEEFVINLCKFEYDNNKESILAKLFLALPLTKTELKKWMIFVAANLSDPKKLDFLKYLNKQAISEQLNEVIHELISQRSSQKTIADTGIFDIKNAQFIAELYTLIGEHECALQSLKEASQYSININNALAELSKKLAFSSKIDDRVKTDALEEARVLSSAEISRVVKSESISENKSQHRIDIKTLPLDVGIINASKYLYNQDDLTEYISEATAGLLSLLERDENIVLSEGITVTDLVEAYPENFRHPNYGKLIKTLLARSPNDISIIKKAIILANENNDLDKATDLVETLILLQPENYDNRKQLLTYYFKEKRFNEVLEEARELSEHVRLDINDELIIIEALFETGNYEAMIEKGNSLLILTEKNERLLTLMAKGYFNLEKFDEAVENSLKSLEINPKNIISWKLLANSLMAIGSTQKAEECLKKGLHYDPADEEMNYLLGLILTKKGEISDGLKYISKVRDFTLYKKSEVLIITQNLINAGYLDHAEEILNSMPNEDPIQSEKTKLLIKIFEQRKDYSNLFIAYQSMGNPNEFSPIQKWKYATVLTKLFENEINKKWDISKAANLFDCLQNEGDRNEASNRFTLGKLAFFAQKNEESIEIISQIIKEEISGNQDLGEAKTWLAHASLAAGRVDLAIVSYKEAILLNPQNINAKIGLAKSYSLADLHDESARIAESVYAENYEDQNILFWFAEFIRSLGNYQKSADAYSKLISISEDEEYKVNYAELLLEQKQMSECKKILLDLYETNIRSKDLCCRASKISEKIGELDLAIGFITKLQTNQIFLDSEQNLLISSLYYQKGSIREAIFHLDIISTQDPHNIAVKALQAILYINLGEFSEAITILETLKQEIIEIDSVHLHNLFPSLIPAEIKMDFILANLINAYQAIGEYEKSFKVAEALAFTRPEKAQYQAKSAELAFLNGDFDLAYQLLDISRISGDLQNNFFDGPEMVDHPVTFLAGLRAHLALEKGEIEEAKRILSQITDEESSCDLQLAFIRLLSLTEGVDSAKKTYFEGNFENCGSIWLGPTLFDIELWEEAFDVSHSYRNQYGLQPPAAFIIANVLEQKIWQEHTFRKILGIQVRIPSHNLIMKISAEEGRFQKTLNNNRFSLHGDSPESSFTEALQLFTNNQIENCRHICSKYPNYPKLVLLNSIASLDIDPDSAIQLAKQVVEALPQSGFSHRAMAMVAERTHNLSLATQAMEQAISFISDDPSWHSQIAEWYVKDGKILDAINHLEKVYELDKENDKVAYSLAKMYLEIDESEKSIAVLEILEQKNISNDISLELARAYLKLKNPDTAITFCEKVANSSTANEDELISCSKIAIDAGQYEKAFLYSKRAVIKNPENPTSIVLLARALAERDGTNEGLRILEKAIDKGHQSIIVRKEHALFVHKQHGIDQAKPLIQKLLNENVDDPELFGLMAVAKFYDREFGEAKAFATKAIQNNTQNSDVFVILGQINHEDGHLDQAIENFTKAIEINPNETNTYLLMVDVFKERREFHRANELLLKAIKQFPLNSDLLIMTADLYKEGKNYQEAAELLQKASELCPTDISIKRQLGAVLALNLVHFSQEAHSIL